MDVRGLAAASAAEIRQRGWCKGVSEDEEGRVCIYGAIGAVERREGIRREDVGDDLRDEVRKRAGEFLLGEWNDSRESLDEVLAVFDSIAAE